jgi:hypothetical protein
MGSRPAWIKTSLCISAVWSGSMLFAISLSTCYSVCKRMAWILIRLRGCACWYGSMLVANALCCFCHGAAHMWNWLNKNSNFGIVSYSTSYICPKKVPSIAVFFFLQF